MEIDSFFIMTDKKFSAYQNDVKTRRAVERNIEIIGEAMIRIVHRNEKIIIFNSRKIVDDRNRIIHGYDTVTDEVIWGIVVKYLPTLQKEIQFLLNENANLLL